MSVEILPRQPAGLATSPRTRRGRWELLSRLSRHRPALVGALLMALMIGLAVVGPLIAPVDPIDVNPRESLRPPSLAHPMGTDQYGRDVLSRVIVGARLSLQIGFIAILIAGTCGVLLGLMAGFYGGKADALIMRGVDILMAFPSILMALVVVAITGPGTTNVMLAVGVSLIATYVRLVRSVTLVVREQLYVQAARVIGAQGYRVLVRHILPNVFAPILVLSTVAVAWSILIGASLSFLGLGPAPPTPEWGIDLSNGRSYLRAAWWISTFPGLAITLTIFGVNLLGDGLREALDPRLRRTGDF
jgi:peptide/nickel transport system permease protein